MAQREKFQLAKTYAVNKNKVPVKSRKKAIGIRASWLRRQNAFLSEMDDSIFDSEDSLKDDYWMDPFDHIAKGKTPLRRQKVLHKNVRADFNRDSSIDCSPTPLSPLIATTYPQLDSPMSAARISTNRDNILPKSTCDQTGQNDLASTPAATDDTSARPASLHSIVGRKLFAGVPGSLRLPGSSEMDSSCEASRVALNAGNRASLLLRKAQRLFGPGEELADTSYGSFLDGMPPTTSCAANTGRTLQRELPVIPEKESRFFQKHGTPITTLFEEKNDPGISNRRRNVQRRLLNYTPISDDDVSTGDIFASVISDVQNFLACQKAPQCNNYLDCVEEVGESLNFTSAQEIDRLDDAIVDSNIVVVGANSCDVLQQLSSENIDLAERTVPTTRLLRSSQVNLVSGSQPVNDEPNVAKDGSSEVPTRSLRSRTVVMAKSNSGDKTDTNSKDAKSVSSSSIGHLDKSNDSGEVEQTASSCADMPPKRISINDGNMSKQKTFAKINGMNSKTPESSDLHEVQITDGPTVLKSDKNRHLRNKNRLEIGENRLPENLVSQPTRNLRSRKNVVPQTTRNLRSRKNVVPQTTRNLRSRKNVVSQTTRSRKNQRAIESVVHPNIMSSTSSKISSNDASNQCDKSDRHVQTTIEGSNGIRLSRVNPLASNTSKAPKEKAGSIDIQKTNVIQEPTLQASDSDGKEAIQVQIHTKKSLRSRRNLNSNRTSSSRSVSLQRSSSNNSTPTDSGIEENRGSSEIDPVAGKVATEPMSNQTNLPTVSSLGNVGDDERMVPKDPSNPTERSSSGAISIRDRHIKIKLKRLKPDRIPSIRQLEVKLKRLKPNRTQIQSTESPPTSGGESNSREIAQPLLNTLADFSNALQKSVDEGNKSAAEPRKYNLRSSGSLENISDSRGIELIGRKLRSKSKNLSENNSPSIEETRNRNSDFQLTTTKDNAATENEHSNRKKLSAHTLQDTQNNPSTINEKLSINVLPKMHKINSGSDRIAVLAERTRQSRRLKAKLGVTRKSIEKTLVAGSPLLSIPWRHNLRSKSTNQKAANAEHSVSNKSIQLSTNINCHDSLEQNSSWTSDITADGNPVELSSVEDIYVSIGSQSDNVHGSPSKEVSVNEVTLNHTDTGEQLHSQNNFTPEKLVAIIDTPTEHLGDFYNISNTEEAESVPETPPRTICDSDTSSNDSIDSVLGMCVANVLRQSIDLKSRDRRHGSLRRIVENDNIMGDLHQSDEEKSRSLSFRKRRTPSLQYEKRTDTKKSRIPAVIIDTISELEHESDTSVVNHLYLTSDSAVEGASKNATAEDICVDASGSMIDHANFTKSPQHINRTNPKHTEEIPEIRINTDQADLVENVPQSSLSCNAENSTVASDTLIQSSARSSNISDFTNKSYNTTDMTPNQTTMPSILDISIDRDNFINAINQNATKFLNKSVVRVDQSNVMNLSASLLARVNNSIQDVSRNPSATLGPPIRTSSKSVVSENVSLVQLLCDETMLALNDNSLNFTTNSLASNSVILSSGKWRRSLRKWKIASSYLSTKTIIDVADPNTTQNNSSQLTIENSSKKSEANPSNLNSPRPNTSYMQISSHRSIRVNDSYGPNLLNESTRLNSFHKIRNKTSGLVSTLPELLIEDSVAEEAINEQNETNVLLLEPTDDGTSNLRSISLLESAVERNLHISSSRSSQKSAEQATTEPTTTVVVDSSYTRRIFNEFEESTECRRQIYQHQLSVPVFRQTPLPRRCTSHIERCSEHSIIPIPTSGGRQRNCNGTGDQIDDANLDCTNFNFLHVPYEGGIRSPSLNSRDRVLRRCNQSEPLDFSVVYSENVLEHCRKIGEGVYGEVYMNKTASGEAVVLKIIPIEGIVEVNGEHQKKFGEVLSEIVIAMELSALRDEKNFKTGGFVEVKKVCCVQGRYPDHLIEFWELYRDNYGTENDHPEIFPDDQLYLVFELANGGQDLEAFTFQNALQSYSAFIQTALTLAIAEQKFQFEHRDLHWGNILLAPTDDEEIVFRLKGEEIKVASHGVKVTIIDYTLSRMVYEGCCLYNDLSTDVELFLAGGDYQFDIYRFMKQHVKNQWETFEPFTNILWLHYTIDKMISGARYRCSKSKKHRSAIHDMMLLRDDILSYKSASDYVENLNK